MIIKNTIYNNLKIDLKLFIWYNPLVNCYKYLITVKTFYLQIFISFFLFLTVFVSSVFGIVNPPDFPSCVNPQGSVVASYSTGTHGVPGVTTAYQGSDTVYKITNEILSQCLCTENSEGIQTNWWKVSSLSSNDIESLKTQGWVFIPDGSAWGLDSSAYLAKNSNYSCRGIGGIGGGEVLGLAATGNIKTIYLLIVLGIISLTLSYFLKRKDINWFIVSLLNC